MSVHDILKQLERILSLQERNITLSPYTKRRIDMDFLNELMGESQELMDELEDDAHDRGPISKYTLDELGDVIGSFSLVVLSMKQYLEEACNMQIAKYRRRKPHIFPDHEGKIPPADEELRIWLEAKKKEKEL
jgi:uncharacterized protein YabN with tetrapyrrole methylase and pyrophosphatase domain